MGVAAGCYGQHPTNKVKYFFKEPNMQLVIKKEQCMYWWVNLIAKPISLLNSWYKSAYRPCLGYNNHSPVPVRCRFTDLQLIQRLTSPYQVSITFTGSNKSLKLDFHHFHYLVLIMLMSLQVEKSANFDACPVGNTYTATQSRQRKAEPSVNLTS